MKSCCCCSLRKGCMCVARYQIAISMISFAMTAYRMITGGAHYSNAGGLFPAILFAVGIVLLRGIQQNDPCAMLWWIVLQIIWIVIEMGLFGYLISLVVTIEKFKIICLNAIWSYRAQLRVTEQLTAPAIAVI
ncbi:hypothetical protein BV898_01829 [Hypsibius exemplaris]|uniref:Uncharacterized protein n=1 Tax=Hypsibius exemplaris TaxID=2072580 RepID=A0A1W0X9S3_HYPEX|nr:hypothetical protein BV898_01829 [Hypsibius exemplaris]